MLIGISGKIGVGKSTLASYLADSYGFARFAVADELKMLCHDYFRTPLGDRSCKPMRPHDRDILQRTGRLFREFHPDIWINRLDENIRTTRGNDPDLWEVVVDDIRYLNEVHWVKRNGGLLIRILDNTATAGDKHESEIDLDNFYGWDGVYQRRVGSTPIEMFLFADDVLRRYAERYSQAILAEQDD